AAAGEGEVPVQLVGNFCGPHRQRAEHHRRVEHLVVVRKGVHRDRVKSGGGQARPHVAGQGSGDGFQLGPVGAPGPVALGGALEFALRADAGGAGNRGGEWLRGGGHVVVLTLDGWITAGGRNSRVRRGCAPS